MSGGTGIEWTDRTWNPVRGCTRVSEGCRHCYAERQAARYSGPGMPFEGFALNGSAGPRWTGLVQLITGKLLEPLSWKKPQRVFVNSMSDLFHPDLLDDDIAAVFAVMAACPDITFQILTKRPERALSWFRYMQLRGGLGALIVDYLDRPSRGLQNVVKEEAFFRAWFEFDHQHGMNRIPLPNVWLGVSVEDQETADERIVLLLQTPAAVRFVSYEPALAPVDFRSLQPGDPPTEINCLAGSHGVLRPHRGQCERIDWLIIGGESGPGARPFDLAWARDAVAQARAAGVPVFVKQMGSNPIDLIGDANALLLNLERRKPLSRHARGADPLEWPEDLRVREFPQERA